jgi:hypothetical protein
VFGDAAKVLIISTPAGETGKFHSLFVAAESGLLPSASAVHAPVWEIDSTLGGAWREARRAELGEDVFRQEYGAEFVAGGGQFFDLRGVEFESGPAQPEEGRNWVASLDPAFHADRFGVALVGESVAEPGVLLVGRVEAIAPGGRLRSLDLRRGREDRTLEKVAEIIGPYSPRIVTDQHQADAVRSYFGRLGLSVKVVNLTGPLQTACFMSTRSRMVDGSLRLWRCAQLIEDLRRVRARDTETIYLPRYAGGHCDAASALALACFELRGATGAPAGDVRIGYGSLLTGDDPGGGQQQIGRRPGWVDPDRGPAAAPPSIRHMQF